MIIPWQVCTVNVSTKILSTSALVAAVLPSKPTWWHKLLSLDNITQLSVIVGSPFSYNTRIHSRISGCSQPQARRRVLPDGY